MMLKAGAATRGCAVPSASRPPCLRPRLGALPPAMVHPVMHPRNIRCTRSILARASEDDPFADQIGEDDSKLLLKWLNTAMYRWYKEPNGLPEYEYGGKKGKAALIAAVNEIYEFADADLLGLKRSMNKEVDSLYDGAERKLKDVRTIVEGVQAASLAATTVAGGTALLPGGFLISTGLTVADGIQQAATQPETQKRMAALSSAIGKLNALDIKSMSEIDEFNDALLSITGNIESPSTSVRDGTQGFLMAMKLARDAGVSFEKFMDDLTEEFIASMKNFDTQLKTLDSLDENIGDVNFANTGKRWVAITQNTSKSLQATGLATGIYFQRALKSQVAALSGMPKEPSKFATAFKATRVGRKFTAIGNFMKFGTTKVSKLSASVKTQKLKTRIKGLKAFTVVVTLVAVGLQISSLVQTVNDFDKLEDDLKNGEQEVMKEVRVYVDGLEDTQQDLFA